MPSPHDHALVKAAVTSGKGHGKTLRANCPLCVFNGEGEDKRRSLKFYKLSGFYKCFRCGSMGVIGGTTGPVAWGMDGPLGSQVQRVPFSATDGPADFQLLDPIWERYDAFHVVRYLEGRRFTRDIARRTHMGVCFTGAGHEKPWMLKERLVVPHLLPDGTWWGYTARDYSGRRPKAFRFVFPKGMASDKHLFNEQALQVKTDTPCLVVEGVLDALEYMPHVVACQGKPKPSHLSKFLKAKRPVVFVLDGDAWREGRAYALSLRIESRPSGYVHLPPTTDPNDARVDPDWVQQRAFECIHEQIQL